MKKKTIKITIRLALLITMLTAALASPAIVFADDEQPAGGDSPEETQTTEEPTAIPTETPTEIPSVAPEVTDAATDMPTGEAAAPEEGSVSAQVLGIISPSDTTVYVTKPTFRWEEEEDATKYQFYVYQLTINGSKKIYDKVVTSTACTDSVCRSTPTTSLAYGKYKWKVRSYDGSAWSAFTEYAYFTVWYPIPSPKTPNTTIYEHTPEFRWGEIINATQYQIQVYNSAGSRVLNQITEDFSCSESICSVTSENTFSNGVYKWHIRAYQGGAWRSYSSYKSFSIAGDFSSSFNGSASGWVKHVGASWNFNSSKYYYTEGIANLMNSTRYKYSYDNFEYEVLMKRDGGAINGYYPASYICVRMGTGAASGNLWYSGYVFGYTNEGDYSIWRMNKSGSATVIQPWTHSDEIVVRDWNLLKVVAEGSDFEFYINDELVNSFSDATFTKGYVGVQMYRPPTGSSRLYLDYANLSIISAESLSANGVSGLSVNEHQEALNEEALNKKMTGSIQGHSE